MKTKWLRSDPDTHATITRYAKARRISIKQALAVLVETGEKRQEALARYRRRERP